MKTWRVYFHKRDGQHPVVWSIDEGSQQTEIHVQWFSLGRGVEAYSFFNAQAAPGEPSGWLVVQANHVLVENGGAVFSVEGANGA